MSSGTTSRSCSRATSMMRLLETIHASPSKHTVAAFGLLICMCLSHEKNTSADDEVQMAYLVVHHLVTWFHVMETSPRRKVTPEQAGKMMVAGTRFLKAHEHLVYYASQHHLLRWKDYLSSCFFRCISYIVSGTISRYIIYIYIYRYRTRNYI